MKIAIVVPSLKNKAPILIATSLAEYFVEQGHSVTIFNLRGECDLPISQKIVIRNVGFFENLNLREFDIVHSHMLRPDAFVFLRKLFSRKLTTVSTIHNYVYPELRNYYNLFISLVFGFVWKIFWSNFNALAVLTEHAKRYYEKISFNKKIYRLYNGRDITVDKSLIEPRFEDPIQALRDLGLNIIGAYCNIINRKGIDILIRHASRVQSSAVVVFGDGPELLRLKNLCISLNLQERVLFLGATPHAHQYTYLFDVFAIPSRDEGFGLALIEAALHGKEIICSNIPVFSEMFDSNCVTFFDLDDEQTIDKAVSAVIAGTRKSENAYKKARDLYSVSAMGDSYLELYSKLLPRSRK